VIEILSESNVSLEYAAWQAVAKVSVTIHTIKLVYIEDQSVKVENGTIKSCHINAKVSFILD